MNTINKLDNGTGETDPALYQVDAKVHQLDRDGRTLRKYVFKDVFPTNISTIDLSYETTDTIQEFTVEMQVHYWEAYKGRAMCLVIFSWLVAQEYYQILFYIDLQYLHMNQKNHYSGSDQPRPHYQEEQD